MKHILITGSTDGIGKLLAKKLAHEGHQVYLHGRNVDKLTKVIDSIKTETGNANISGFVADFSELNAVKKMAEEVITNLPQLDVLINNAGIFKTNQSVNADGMDVRLVVNYIAPYVLTNQLLAQLEKAQKPRIINLSSAAQAPVSLTALQSKAPLDTNEAYAQSKLALTMWSFDLAKELGSRISVIAVNPGSLLDTKMANEAYGQHWSSADKGVNILHELALSEEYVGVTGKYFDNDKGKIKGAFAQAHPDAYNATKIADLLAITQAVIAENEQCTSI